MLYNKEYVHLHHSSRRILTRLEFQLHLINDLQLPSAVLPKPSREKACQSITVYVSFKFYYIRTEYK